MSGSILKSTIYLIVALSLAIYCVRLLKRKARDTQHLSQKREFDSFVIWNMLLTQHSFRQVYFLFPYDKENPEVVRALRKGAWAGKAAIISVGFSLLSFIGLLLTIFVGPPGAH